ncbi:MAG: hypothetical protein AVDCRST_MAG87-1804 [uncultured Thermomicrobiales bacterium]|uniref:Uncharacterized protein n=1 Tax=uncultured Thermomicrobiales bacterium TaxID=1645740 RepID=A0A6J4V353_9BACT|nr:MAG: hypothetical protein AVDCRST_MAG87-1804 [uncultured Thermomicrobiales bacterium]
MLGSNGAMAWSSVIAVRLPPASGATSGCLHEIRSKPAISDDGLVRSTSAPGSRCGRPGWLRESNERHFLRTSHPLS